MKQSAVEWLFENSHIVPKTELNKRKLIEQAKEMEKKQQGYSEEDMKDAYIQGTLGLEYKKSFNESFYKWFEQFKKK